MTMYPGCDCEGQQCSVGCLCLLANGPVCDVHGCLVCPEDERILVECNSNCSCGIDCPNRSVQRGGTIHLDVFRTNHKGLGVKTLEKIARHQFVCNYVGDVIRKAEATRRTKVYGTDKPNYIFTLREHVESRGILCTYVDATTTDCIAKYINHSCQPNLFMSPVRVECIVPTLALFAARTIDIGEELCFDYSGGEQEEETETRSAGQNKIPCYCESPNCRGYLPYSETLF